MLANDKQQFFDTLQSVMDVFGKQRITPGAAQIWWDTLKEFDHNAVFTTLNYWAQYNAKPPLPADVWKQLNDQRTASLEKKAAIERSENRGDRLPADYSPTPEGKALFKILRKFLGQKVKSIHHMILDEHEEYGNMPKSVVEFARREHNKEKMQMAA